MPWNLYKKIRNDICGHGIFVHRRYATRNGEINTEMWIIPALRVMGRAIDFDTTDELYRVQRQYDLNYFHEFVKEILEVYDRTYYRHPTEEYLRCTSYINEARGFSGRLRSQDLQHWKWNNCSIAWERQLKGKKGCKTIVLELIAYSEIWIWCEMFESSGSLNDFNVLD